MTANPVTKSALVTGATGFIGSHLVVHLLKAGWKVGVIGRAASLQRVAVSADYTTYDYTGRTSEVLAALEEFRPTAVFHLASLFLAAHTAEQIEPLIDSNVLFGTQLLEAMRRTDCSVVVNAGTGWQNYTPEPPYDAPEFCPVNLYAATKQAFEDILLYYVQTAGLRSITLRLFDSYGPADQRRKLVRLFLEALKTGRALSMSPGEQILDFVHVDDICRAFLTAADLALNLSAPAASVYAVSGNQRLTLKQLASTFEAAAGRRLPIQFGQLPYRPREVMHPWEGPALPGWKPQITLEEGFRRLIAEENSGAERA
jgi:nucleoside-diphosphate-sugar epimerase